MSIQYIGSEYGGWPIDLDLITPRSTVISGGIGTDASFDKSLIKLKQCNVIGIDPTKKSHDYIEQENINGLTLIKAALTGERKTKDIKIYKQKTPIMFPNQYSPQIKIAQVSTTYLIQSG